jgi:hypothetical protein
VPHLPIEQVLTLDRRHVGVTTRQCWAAGCYTMDAECVVRHKQQQAVCSAEEVPVPSDIAEAHLSAASSDYRVAVHCTVHKRIVDI